MKGPRHIVYIDVPAGRGTRRVKLSMLSFVQECISDSCEENTMVTISSYLQSGLVKYGITESVANLALNFNWYWQLNIYVVSPNGDVDYVELTPDQPLRLGDLEGLAQPTRLELLAANPDALRWGWRAKILRSPM